VAAPIVLVIIWMYTQIKKRASTKISKTYPASVCNLGAKRRKAFQKALRKALGNADRFVQKLNSYCTDISGQ
jgi:hypothetical protein